MPPLPPPRRRFQNIEKGAETFEAPRTSHNKFHDLLGKTIEETTETKDNNLETIELRVFKNE